MARYLVNAGPVSADSWYRNEEVEGSRFVGEGGHFVDTLSWWIGSEPVEVAAQCAGGRDDLQVTLRYGDGSLGTITYLVNGHPRFPKETFEVFSAGRSARLDNFRRATVWAGRRRVTNRSWSSPDKGQRREVGAFLDSVRSGAPMPIPLGSLVATTRATLGAAASLTSGASETVARGRGPAPGTGRGPRRTVNSSRLEWYLRRLEKMSASEVAWRLSDYARKVAWARHQVPVPGAAATPARRSLAPHRSARAPALRKGFDAVLDPGRARSRLARGAPARHRRRRPDPRRPLRGPGRDAQGPRGPGLVLRPRDGPQGAPGRLLLQDRPPLRGRHGQREAGVGALAHAPPHRPGRRLRLLR